MLIQCRFLPLWQQRVGRAGKGLCGLGVWGVDVGFGFVSSGLSSRLGAGVDGRLVATRIAQWRVVGFDDA